MPGGFAYKMHLVWEKLIQYWYFGSFGQFDFSLKESDKYLVEAKTLFEYNQYLLGYNALIKSNLYFAKIDNFLTSAQNEGKNISEKKALFLQATLKHIEILKKIKNETPSEFRWNPEKSSETKLEIWNLIDNSIKEREHNLE